MLRDIKRYEVKKIVVFANFRAKSDSLKGTCAVRNSKFDPAISRISIIMLKWALGIIG